MIYALFRKGKLVTLGEIERRERPSGQWHLDPTERTQVIAGCTKGAVKRRFLHFVGFTWPEWKDDYSIEQGTFL